MRFALVLLLLVISAIPVQAGMYRLHALNFHIVLDDSCVTRDVTEETLWVDCSTEGLSVTFLIRWMQTYSLPRAGSARADPWRLIPAIARVVQAQTEWESLLSRLDWGGGARLVGHTLEGAGNLCPSPVVSTHICSYDVGTKSAALRAVETNLGTIVLVAIGDRAEPTKPSFPTIALPETAIAMIESFTSALAW